MSVQTTADEHKDSALDHISSAVKDFSQIFVDECWGHDEYSPEYRSKLEQTFEELLKIKKRFRD